MFRRYSSYLIDFVNPEVFLCTDGQACDNQ